MSSNKHDGTQGERSERIVFRPNLYFLVLVFFAAYALFAGEIGVAAFILGMIAARTATQLGWHYWRRR